MNEIERQRLAVQADPSDPLLRYNLAALVHAGGDPVGALHVLDEALASAPRVARLHYGRACALQSLGRLEKAISAYRNAAEIEPDFSDAWYGLGTACQARGDAAGAITCYERVVTLEPDHAAARHLIAALRGECPQGPPPGFVRSLFDSYADRYDEHLTGALEYRAHELMEAAVLASVGRRTGLDVLDLGCGTGLFGERIRPLTSRLVGVDVSPGMLRKASERRLYDALEQADLLGFLVATPPQSFDLVTAVDVFSYIGSLEPVVRQAQRILRPNGLLAFTVEAGDAGYALGPTGRYRHGRSYLDGLRELAGLGEVRFSREALRKESGQPCDGFVVLWQPKRRL